MALVYGDNANVITFVNRAQNKIAELGELIATELEDEYHLQMAIELSDFLESLYSKYNTWTLVQVLRYIDFWNTRANLNNKPFIQITNYQVNINSGQPSSFDINTAVFQALLTFPHNSLFALQGGIEGERYHLTKTQRAWLICQMAKTPCPDIIQPAVGLSIVTDGLLWISGYYELGTTITNTTLYGSFQLNSGRSILSYNYLRNAVILSNTITPNILDPVPSYNDTTPISSDLTFEFTANFELGGVKSQVAQIRFKQPMFYGTKQRSLALATNPYQFTKDVRNVGSMNLQFILPVGNSLLNGGNEITPVVVFPRIWGNPTSVKVGVYDFITDWTFTNSTMLATDGITTFDIIKGVFTPVDAVEGTVEFNFNF